MSRHGTGLYVLGDDGALVWLQASLRSIRRALPSAPVTLIPFSDHLERTERLARRLDVAIDGRDLSSFDRLGERFNPTDRIASQMFRKLACFSGPYDRFWYIDSDVVVEAPARALLASLDGLDGHEIWYIDSDISDVYLGDLAPEMVRAYGSHGFNAGIFASTKGTIDDERIERALAAGLAASPSFAPTCDQPFFNFITDTQRIARRRWEVCPEGSAIVTRPEFNPEIGLTHWAGQPLGLGMGRDLSYLRAVCDPGTRGTACTRSAATSVAGSSTG